MQSVATGKPGSRPGNRMTLSQVPVPATAGMIVIASPAKKSTVSGAAQEWRKYLAKGEDGIPLQIMIKLCDIKPPGTSPAAPGGRVSAAFNT